nr:Disulfide oxidoreductase [Klebsiella pneumoniae]
MAIWLYSAIRGLQLAWEHTMIQLHPSPFQTCDFAARFPTRLPLDKWLPQVFVASGDCSVRQWQFLSLEMPQWLVGIFAAYLLVAILVIVAQPFKAKNAICLVVKPRQVQPTMKRPAGVFLCLLRIAESFHVYG